MTQNHQNSVPNIPKGRSAMTKHLLKCLTTTNEYFMIKIMNNVYNEKLG